MLGAFPAEVLTVVRGAGRRHGQAADDRSWSARCPPALQRSARSAPAVRHLL